MPYYDAVKDVVLRSATVMADPRTRDAARAARALPAFGLDSVAARVGMSHRQMVMTLQNGLGVRGRCAALAAAAVMRRPRHPRGGAATAAVVSPPVLRSVAAMGPSPFQQHYRGTSAWTASDSTSVGAKQNAAPRRVLAVSASRVDNLDKRCEAAAYRSGPSLMLARLAADWYWMVRVAVANNTRAPYTLALLAEDDEPMVRRAAAENPACSPCTLRHLAEDPEHTIRTAAAQSLACPSRNLGLLSSEPGASTSQLWDRLER